MKYLIWAVVLYFAWRWYLTSKEKAARAEAEVPRTDARDPAAPTASRSAAASDASGVEKMVGCAHCGILLPVSEALTGADQRHYCCEEHRAQHPAS